MVAAIALSPTFAVTERHSLFTAAFLSSGRFPEYDVTPDGQHFVMVRGKESRVPLIVLSNTFDRLFYDRQGRK
jgi:hypothetical protein